MIYEPWSQIYSSAPLTGGHASGGDRFFVDGNFYTFDPCSLPVISYPLKGDSIFSNRDIIFYNPAAGTYGTYPLGTYPNIQPWSPNQSSMVLEQEFMIAQEAFQSIPLNFPYWPGWALGFPNQMINGYPIPSLQEFYLVAQGELQDMGGGICKVKLTFATIPQTRNEIEQFSYSFIGFSNQSPETNRERVAYNVQSRVQYDYFIFDDLNVLATPLFPAGNRLNQTIAPSGLILPAMTYWANVAGVSQNIYTDYLDDGPTPPILTTETTIPTFTQYVSIIKINGTASTSNGLPAELIAEASTMSRYMGNIWERRTRFVVAQ